MSPTAAAIPGRTVLGAGTDVAFELLVEALAAKHEASRVAERAIRRKVARLFVGPAGPQEPCVFESQPHPDCAVWSAPRLESTLRVWAEGKPFLGGWRNSQLVPEVRLPRKMAERYLVSQYLDDIGFVRPPPRRFRTLRLSMFVEALFDPFELLFPSLLRRSGPPRAVPAAILRPASRARRLSIPEKTYRLFHVALGFFGVRKVDARNCP